MTSNQTQHTQLSTLPDSAAPTSPNTGVEPQESQGLWLLRRAVLFVIVILHLCTGWYILTADFTNCETLYYYLTNLFVLNTLVATVQGLSWARRRYGDGGQVTIPSIVYILAYTVLQGCGAYALAVGSFSKGQQNQYLVGILDVVVFGSITLIKTVGALRGGWTATLASLERRHYALAATRDLELDELDLALDLDDAVLPEDGAVMGTNGSHGTLSTSPGGRGGGGGGSGNGGGHGVYVNMGGSGGGSGMYGDGGIGSPIGGSGMSHVGMPGRGGKPIRQQGGRGGGGGGGGGNVGGGEDIQRDRGIHPSLVSGYNHIQGGQGNYQGGEVNGLGQGPSDTEGTSGGLTQDGTTTTATGVMARATEVRRTQRSRTNSNAGGYSPSYGAQSGDDMADLRLALDEQTDAPEHFRYVQAQRARNTG